MKITFFATLLFTLTLNSFAQELNLGDTAPEFSALADDGSMWNAKDYLGSKFIVVYFYPAAMTGGCTKQACAYRDLKNDIDKADALVVGVSGDNVDGLKLFKKVHELNFPLLSDENGEIAKKFGVPIRDGGSITREIDGQNIELFRSNTPSRWTFIIDKKGSIVYKNTAVDASNDSSEILEFIKNNS
ncbi:peroxiredoxin [uncultured Draconibacterium sp.]|uniref:peroxiredoxin n=1 Tax=uncultured Draconibacterium sp. TaxID=1573823 RepID=UPI0025D978A9|nr:peroxiredoxin [uncultured Draconibacterium sp.]